MSNSRPDREQRRSAILQAARESFCDKGYEQTAVAEIATRVGVVEGTVYRYFESKHELLIEVLMDWYQQMFDDYAHALEGVAGARPRLQLLIWRHLRTIRDAPQLCRLMFREARDDVGQANATLRKLNRRYTRFLVEVVDEGSRSGAFRSDIHLPLLRDLIYGGIEHYCWRYLSGEGELNIDQAAEDITRLFCDGISQATPSADDNCARLNSLIDRMETLLRPAQA